VYEIERCFRQRIRGYVVTARLEVREVEGLKKTGIDVGRQYASRGADAIGQPTGDRSTAGAHL
jgi:hypothetical protein